MSFGAFILTKNDGEDRYWLLPSRHICAITEIRVEQHLDKQTTFAVRFQEDFENTAEVEEAQKLFAKSLGFAICASDGIEPSLVGTTAVPPGITCLVLGQVENVEWNVTVGGSGSWFEVRGQDNRTEINRSVEIINKKGSTKDIIAALVGVFADEVEVGDEIKNYVENSYTFRGSALEAVYDLARKSNYSFWVKYTPEAQSETFTIKTSAFVKPSPGRKDQAPPDSFDGLELVPEDEGPKFRIVGDDTECETVVNFSSKVDNEAYQTATSAAQKLATGEPADTKDATSENDDLNKDGENVVTVGGEVGPPLELDVPGIRKFTVEPEPEDELAPWRAYAAATEASWYVTAEALTTVHMLQHVLAPHDIVEVVGGGCGIAGIYQVTDVTHVINAAEHWMEVKLRSNSRNLTSHPNLP